MTPAAAAIKGVLFDKDGTLFFFDNGWTAVLRAVADALARSGTLTSDDLMIAIGWDPASGEPVSGGLLGAGTVDEIAAAWHRLRPDLSPDQLRRMMVTSAELANSQIEPVAGMQQLIRNLKAAGYAVGLATHDGEHSARHHLRSADIEDAFDFIAGADSGHGLKPGPGMLEAFCAATGLSAAQVAVIGDNSQDIGMGRNGGAGLSIGVLTGTSAREHLAPIADLVLDDVTGLRGVLKL